jgi:hypothetical protein
MIKQYNLAQQPISLPAVQVAAPSGLQQQGFGQAAQTGVGEQAVGQGIQSLQAGLGAAYAGPNISQFYNPYQSYVLMKLIDKHNNNKINYLHKQFKRVHLVVVEKVYKEQNYKEQHNKI